MLRSQMMSILLNFLILKLPTLPLPDSQTTYYAELDLLQQQKQNNNKFYWKLEIYLITFILPPASSL